MKGGFAAWRLAALAAVGLALLPSAACEDNDDQRAALVITAESRIPDPEIPDLSWVCLTDDGRVLGEQDGAVWAYRLNRKLELVRRPSIPLGSLGNLTCDPSGQVIATANRDYIWFTSAGRERVAAWGGFYQPVLAVTPDRRRLLAAGAVLHVYDLSGSGKPVTTMGGPADPPAFYERLVAGPRYAAAWISGKTYVWDLTEGRFIRSIRTECAESGVALSSDEPVVTVCAAETVQLVDIRDGRVVDQHRFVPPPPATHVFGFQPEPSDVVSVSPDARFMVAGFDDGVLAVWDRHNGVEARATIDTNVVAGLAFTGPNQLLVHLGGRGEDPGGLRVVRLNATSA